MNAPTTDFGARDPRSPGERDAIAVRRGRTCRRVGGGPGDAGASGSTFDSFLEEEGIRAEVEGVAIKRVLAWQLQQAMKSQQKTKQAMARQLHTSRSQLDRLLDPENVSVTLDTITRAARALGKRVIVRLANVREVKHDRA